MSDRAITRLVAGSALWLLLIALTGFIGGLASIEASSFYEQLVQPAWAPPPWLFGPVWSVLYVLMAISVSLIWHAGGLAQYPLAYGMFTLQLFLNGLWSWLFFAWALGGLAFVEILLLWAAIVVTAKLFWRVRRLAALLLMPYLFWVGFAGILNLRLNQLNPGLL